MALDLTQQPEPAYTALLIHAQMSLATVKIASPETASGYVIINASDFDTTAHTRYVEPTAVTPKGK